MDGRLSFGRAREEETRVEAARFDFRRDPVREVGELVQRKEKAFTADDVGKRRRSGEEVATIFGETRGRCGERTRQQHACLFEELAKRGDVVCDRDPGGDVGHPRDGCGRTSLTASMSSMWSAASTRPPGNTCAPPMNAMLSLR